MYALNVKLGHKRLIYVGLALQGVVYSVDLHALELAADIYTSLSYSSNISLETTDTDKDIPQKIGMNVSLLERRKRFNADASFQLEETLYHNDTFSNKTTLTTGFGIFNFDIVENFLDWRTSFTRSQVLNSAFGADTPDNRENRNVFSTGPNITYRVTRASTLGLSASYVNVENSDADAADTERINGGLNYAYAMNSLTIASVSAGYDEIIDADGGDEVTKTNGQIGIVRQLVGGSLSLNYGRTESKSDTSETVSGDTYDISFIRQQVLWHDVTLKYRESFSDTSIGFELDDDLLGEDGIPVEEIDSDDFSEVFDIVRRKNLSLGLNRALGSLKYNFSGYVSEKGYQKTDNDSKGRGVGFGLSYDFAEDLTTNFTYSFDRTRYLDQPTIDTDRTGTYRLESDYQLSEDVSVDGFVQYERRMNSTNQIREYEEFSMGFGLKWTLF